MLAAIGWVAASSASAHHSFPGTYVENRTVTIEGDLVQAVWRNPHSFIQVLVQERGSRVRYDVEWVGAGELQRQGISPATLKQGDRVIVSGLPSANPSDHRVRAVSFRRLKDGLVWKLVPSGRMGTGYGN